jgi:hypothetical protein
MDITERNHVVRLEMHSPWDWVSIAIAVTLWDDDHGPRYLPGSAHHVAIKGAKSMMLRWDYVDQEYSPQADAVVRVTTFPNWPDGILDSVDSYEVHVPSYAAGSVARAFADCAVAAALEPVWDSGSNL